MPAFNLNQGNQTAQNRLKLQKERNETDELPMPDARRVPVNRILPNPFQVRQDFHSPEAQAALQELANDIKIRGILEPLVVRPVQKDGQELYEIVAGERRYQAAQLIGLSKLPVIVQENWNDQDARLASLAENLQRRDLTLLEEVQFFKALENEYNWSASRIAKLISKSESYVSRRLRLANDSKKLAKLSQEKMTLGEMLLSQSETDEAATSASATHPVERAKVTATNKTHKLNPSVRLVAVTRFREALDRLAEPKVQSQLTSSEREQLVSELALVEQQVALLKATLEGRPASSKSHK